MSATTSMAALLESLTKSLQSTVEATPKLSGIEPTEHGLSLLDVKNEILLSYIQNLVFLILLRIRNSKTSSQSFQTELRDSVVGKLVELRLYLEKGARPLEDKLRYQIERALRVVEDADRSAQVKAAAKESAAASDSEALSNEEDDDDSDANSSDDSDIGSRPRKPSAPEPRASGRPAAPNLAALTARTSGVDKTTDGADGVYRPPKIRPTTMPTTEKRDRAERRPMKSATMDEFIADELSTAPLAAPSIGANIRAGGLHVKTATDRAKDAEREAYEEQNFMRFPKAGKKERAAIAKKNRMTFGGEDWRDLGEGVDRINRLTRGKEGGGGTRALLEKSRKRAIDTTDGPRGSGAVEIGERYQKRLKVQESGGRSRGKKRST